MNYIIHKNPNKTAFDEISKAIKENDGYCCCKLVKDEDTKCLCKEFRETEANCICHCERYYKVGENPKAVIVGTTSMARLSSIEKVLTSQGYIVLGANAHMTSQDYDYQTQLNHLKYIVAAADTLFVVPSDYVCDKAFVEELIDWATYLGKQIVKMEE